MSRAARAYGHLTRREVEVLQALADGLSYAEIAARLCVSIHTVHGHLKHIYTTLVVNGRAGAVGKAMREGLIT